MEKSRKKRRNESEAERNFLFKTKGVWKKAKICYLIQVVVVFFALWCGGFVAGSSPRFINICNLTATLTQKNAENSFKPFHRETLIYTLIQFRLVQFFSCVFFARSKTKDGKIGGKTFKGNASKNIKTLSSFLYYKLNKCKFHRFFPFVPFNFFLIIFLWVQFLCGCNIVWLQFSQEKIRASNGKTCKKSLRVVNGTRVLHRKLKGSKKHTEKIVRFFN